MPPVASACHFLDMTVPKMRRHDRPCRRPGWPTGPRCDSGGRLRDALHLDTDKVLVAHVDAGLVLERPRAVLARLRAAFGAAAPKDMSLVDELLAERQKEAARGPHG